MNYLDSSEYAAHGLDAATPEFWITAASALIDAHCRRPTLGIAQYIERLRLSAGNATVRLAYLPLAAQPPAASPLVSLRARYGQPRRGEAGDLALDVARAFSLPGAWVSLDAAALDFSAETGEITLPLNPLGLAYNEVEITYTAGVAPLPEAVKSACAQIVRNAQATPSLSVRAASLDRMHLDYFADSLLDADVRKLLAPYVSVHL